MQVRLDDDTAAFVAERKARDGGSLSKAANALLRERIAPTETRTVTAIGGETFKYDVPVTSVDDLGTVTHARLPTRETPGATADQLVQATTHATNQHHAAKCKHPLLRRVGNQCAACGSTV